jgi:hypothetical protein
MLEAFAKRSNSVPLPQDDVTGWQGSLSNNDAVINIRSCVIFDNLLNLRPPIPIRGGYGPRSTATIAVSDRAQALLLLTAVHGINAGIPTVS